MNDKRKSFLRQQIQAERLATKLSPNFRDDRASSDATVRIANVHCKAVTAKAILVEIDGDDHWIPQSVVHDDSDVYQIDDYGDLVVHYWFAQKNNLLP